MTRASSQGYPYTPAGREGQVAGVRDLPRGTRLRAADPGDGRFVLVAVDEDIRSLLVRRLAPVWRLEALAGPEQLFDKLEHSPQGADAIVLGVKLKEPVRIAQRVHSLGKDIPILILSDPERFGQLRQALRFTPFLGNDVSTWSSAAADGLPTALQEAATRAQKRRTYRNRVAAAQLRLGELAREPPQVTHYLDRLLDRAPIGVLNVEVHGRILSLNRRAGQILRLSEREALGTSLIRVFPPREHERLRDIIARCVARSRQNPPEVFELGPPDEPRFVEVNASSLVDRTGQLGSTIILQDVTDREKAERERQRAEEALRISEQRYREVVQTMNEALAVIDENHAITYVNRSFCDMFGYTQDEVLGRRLIDLVHEDYREQLQGRMIDQTSGKVERYENAWVTKNGRRIHTLTSPKPLFDAGGRYKGCLGVFTDITERKRAEEALRESEAQLALVTDTVPVLITYLDAGQRFRFNNRAYEDWFGLSRGEMRGRHIKEVIGALAYQNIRPHLETALGGQTVECEVVLPHKQGGPRHLRGSVVPDMSPGGHVRGVVAVVSDVTGLKHAEERERQHMLEMAHVSRVTTMGEMSGQIAHELAQPLTAIATYSDACLRLLGSGSGAPGEIADSLADIAVQARRARDIVVRLRNFVRKEELQYSPVDLNDLVRAVVRLAEVDSRWRELTVKLELADRLPATTADKTLIEQVVLNLVHNAIESMQSADREHGGLTIRTGLSAAGELEVAVIDAGIGLPEPVLERMFEPFYTTKPDGMGMGLAITRSIIKAHGGRIWAVNNEAGGATVRFTLPAADGSVARGEPRA